MLLLPGQLSPRQRTRARAKVMNSPKIGSKQGCMTPAVRTFQQKPKITWSSQHMVAGTTTSVATATSATSTATTGSWTQQVCQNTRIAKFALANYAETVQNLL